MLSESQNSNRSLVRILFALTALVLCFVCLRWLNPTVFVDFDEPYQVLNGMYDSPNPFAPLTAVFTGVLGDLFAWKLMSFHYFAVFANAFCVLLSVVFFYRYTRRYTPAIVLGVVCILLSTYCFNFYSSFYGWDTWTEVGVMALLFAMFSFVKHPGYGLICLVSLLAGLLIVSRIPNIVVLPAIILSLCLIPDLRKDKKNLLRYIAVYVIVTTLVFWLLICMLYGSLGNYIDLLLSTKIDSHGFNILIGLSGTILDVLTMTFIAAGVYFGLRLFRHKKAAAIIAVVLFSSIIFLGELRGRRLNLFPISVGLLLLLGYLYHNRKDLLKSRDCACVFIAVILSLIPVAGSNNGIIKMMIWPLIPVLMAYSWKHIDRASCLAGCTFLIIIVLNALCHRGVMHIPVLGDKKTQTTEINIPELRGYYTDKTNKNKIERIYQAFSPYKENNYELLILRKGNDYVWEYIFRAPNAFLTNRFDYNNAVRDDEYNAWIENKIRNSETPLAVLYIRQPNDNAATLPTLLGRHLEEAVAENDFMIFTNKSILTD